jgi:hypothetical protein
MAFKDITKVLYDGKIKLDYKDKAHRYYVRKRENWDLPVDDPKAWSKIIYPKGTTTLIGDTLEKKGLMKYAMTKCLMDLFGFYDFTDDNGDRKTGYSEKGVQRLWGEDGKLLPYTKEEALEHILFGSLASTRHTKKGGDIGSVVHDAIEHFVNEEDFDIAEAYMWGIKDAFPIPAPGQPDEWEKERKLALEEFAADVECAKTAFLRFQKWWTEVKPTLFGAEDLLYSMEYNVCGTYDADLGIPKEHHPMGHLWPEKDIIRVTTDWKTSNASSSKDAARPEGVGYDYFIQDAIYEMCRREMGMEPADDLLVLSARKDGGFSLIYASELELSVQDCIDWAKAVILCYRMAEKAKAGLIDHAPDELLRPAKKYEKKPKAVEPGKVNKVKEAF